MEPLRSEFLSDTGEESIELVTTAMIESRNVEIDRGLRNSERGLRSDGCPEFSCANSTESLA